MGFGSALLRTFGLATSREVSHLESQVSLAAKIVAQERGTGVPFTAGSFDYEQNANLRGSKKWETLDKMENDSHIKGALRTNALPLLTGKWEVKPASDSARDEEIAEFVSVNLLRTTSERFGPEHWTQNSWMQHLNEILRMQRDGFSMFSLTMKRVGTKRVFDRIQWLEPASVDPSGWRFDRAERLERIERTYSDTQDRYRYREPLSASDLALYVWDLTGVRLEGRQLVRPMYGPWYRKDFVQRQAAIWAQKQGAPPPYGIYPEGYDSESIENFQQFVQACRGEAPAESFGVFPRGSDGNPPEVKYAGSDTTIERGLSGLIQNENSEIGHAGATGSEMLGETETGSRALGESKSKRETLLISATAAFVCEYVNHGVHNLPGLVERLVRGNYGGSVNCPELVWIDPTDGLDNIEILAKAKSAGLVPNHPALRRQVTEQLGYELPDEAYEIETPLMPPPNGANALPNGNPEALPESPNPADAGTEQEPVAAAQLEAAQDFRKRIESLLTPVEDAPKGGRFRGRNRLELEVCNLAAVNESFRVGEQDFHVALRHTRAGMITDLMRRLRAGKITTDTLGTQRRSAYRHTRKAEAELREVADRVGREGASHVDDELERQI